MVDQWEKQGEADRKERGLRVGNKFKRKGEGFSIVIGTCNIWSIPRYCIACFLERELSGCLGQGFGWLPGNQSSLQRIHLLISE